MPVESLGEAHSYGWRIVARWAHGKRDGMKSIRACTYRYAGLDSRQGFSARLAPGAPAVPDVRIAARSVDLHRAGRAKGTARRRPPGPFPSLAMAEPATLP